MTNEELLSRAREIAASGNPANVTKTDAEMIAFLLDNCMFTVPEDAVFFGKVSCADADRKIQGERTARFSKEVYSDELRAGSAARAYTGATDFGHTAPLWDDVFRLGLCGLRERAVSADEPLDPDFPAAEAYVFDAAVRFVLRAAETAQTAGKTAMAAGLRALAVRPPETLFEAMQMTFVWYALQHTIEGTNLRTLGRLDRLFDRFLPADGSDGLFDAFMCALDDYRVAANLPFMLGGSDADGHENFGGRQYVDGGVFLPGHERGCMV